MTRCKGAIRKDGKAFLDMIHSSYFRTTNVAGRVALGDGVEMCLPGDNAALEVTLDKPIALEHGSHFAIREGGKTVGSGVVTEVCCNNRWGGRFSHPTCTSAVNQHAAKAAYAKLPPRLTPEAPFCVATCSQTSGPFQEKSSGLREPPANPR
jgi:hypothetical protein